jgi:hypothetical protein
MNAASKAPNLAASAQYEPIIPLVAMMRTSTRRIELSTDAEREVFRFVPRPTGRCARRQTRAT